MGGVLAIVDFFWGGRNRSRNKREGSKLSISKKDSHLCARKGDDFRDRKEKTLLTSQAAEKINNDSNCLCLLVIELLFSDYPSCHAKDRLNRCH